MKRDHLPPHLIHISLERAPDGGRMRAGYPRITARFRARLWVGDPGVLVATFFWKRVGGAGYPTLGACYAAIMTWIDEHPPYALASPQEGGALRTAMVALMRTVPGATNTTRR